MKIVVTGATGMIAAALIQYSLRKGDEVIAVARRASARLSSIPAGVTVLYADLKDYASFTPKEKADVFFHLAWDKTSVAGRDDAATQERNIAYTLDAVALAKRMGCTAFVGAGSQAEYGAAPYGRRLTPETPCNPQSGYGIAKFAAGRLSALACGQVGMRQSWARILSVYGRGDAPTTLISYLISAFRRGETPALTKCEQVWDYLYAEDCAAALYAIGRAGKHQKAYPVGSGAPRLLSEYVAAVREAVEPAAQIAFGAKDYYPHQPMYLVADISELTKDTGFIPQYTFEEGIALTVREE